VISNAFEGCSYPLATTIPLSYNTGLSYSYDYVTHATLNEAATEVDAGKMSHVNMQQSNARRDVGFTLSARVDLSPVWTSNNAVMLVKLQVGSILPIFIAARPVVHAPAVQNNVRVRFSSALEWIDRTAAEISCTWMQWTNLPFPAFFCPPPSSYLFFLSFSPFLFLPLISILVPFLFSHFPHFLHKSNYSLGRGNNEATSFSCLYVAIPS